MFAVLPSTETKKRREYPKSLSKFLSTVECNEVRTVFGRREFEFVPVSRKCFKFLTTGKKKTVDE
ncbi:MAG: hypothetical protein CL450_08965 [Acidimicrobiaceae bacterium]|nr:hypothetical protein [Acidimicrobiaceae bacterium]